MKPTSILLRNARIIDPVNHYDAVGELLIDKGKNIVAKRHDTRNLPKSTEIVDLTGKWIVPGLIDMHVHLREPGEEYKETIETGTRAAAAGGYTAIACMPNTKPVNDCQAITGLILAKAKHGSCRVYPVGCISKGSKGETLAEYGDLKKAGVVAVTDDGMPVTESQLMRRALEYAGDHELLVISHSEDMSLSKNGVMNEGVVSTRLGLRGIPRVAEEAMVYRDVSLAEYTGQRIHIAHVSTRESVDLIRRAKKKGVRVTAETAPHYFSLKEEDIGHYNTRAKMNPPLRTKDDVAAVIDALQDGTLDAIATDHAPHSILEKDLEFERAANGIIGLETAVPLTLELVRQGVLSAEKMVQLLSCNPATILGVQGGNLGKGAVADVTVIDPEKEFVYREENIVSKSKNSPFIDWSLKGKAILSIVGGVVTFSELENIEATTL